MIEYGRLPLRIRMLTMMQRKTNAFETRGSTCADWSRTQLAKKRQNESGDLLDKGTTNIQRL